MTARPGKALRVGSQPEAARHRRLRNPGRARSLPKDRTNSRSTHFEFARPCGVRSCPGRSRSSGHSLRR
jgi:hypothetical protein